MLNLPINPTYLGTIFSLVWPDKVICPRETVKKWRPPWNKCTTKTEVTSFTSTSISECINQTTRCFTSTGEVWVWHEHHDSSSSCCQSKVSVLFHGPSTYMLRSITTSCVGIIFWQVDKLKNSPAHSVNIVTLFPYCLQFSSTFSGILKSPSFSELLWLMLHRNYNETIYPYYNVYI